MARRKVEYDSREQCEHCGQLHDQSEMSWAEDGTGYCPACTSAMTQTCKCCGKNLPVWEMTGYDAAGNYYCEDCAIAV